MVADQPSKAAGAVCAPFGRRAVGPPSLGTASALFVRTLPVRKRTFGKGPSACLSLNGTMPLAARAAPRPRLHTDARRSWLPATGVPRRPLPRTPGADPGARGVRAHHGKGPCGTVRRWRPYPASTAVSCAPRWRHAPRLGSRARWSASGRCRKRSQRHGLGDCRCPLGCSTGIEALSHACSARCFGCQARSSGPPARTGALPPAVGGSVPTSVAEVLGAAVLTYLPVLWGGWCWRSGAAAGSVQWSPAGARLGGRTTRRRLRAGARSFGRAKGPQRKCLRLWGCDSGHETVLVGDAAGELGVPDRCLVRTSTQIALGWVHRARGGVGAAGGTCPDVGDTVGCG
jgi:hypothetical protein